MHILLTDILTCPRCGPDFGLIVLSDELQERRVRAGSVGCANCRASFPITHGTADLRHPASPALAVGRPLEEDAERPIRVAALMGVQGSNTTVLVLDPSGGTAQAIAELIPDVHVVAGSSRVPDQPEVEGILLSRIATGQRLPLRSGALKGVAALGVDVLELLPEIRRVLLPGSRVVVEPAAESLVSQLEKDGFVVYLEQGGVVVAGTPERG